MPGRATLAPTATCGESRSGDLRDEANQLSLSRAGPGMTTCDAGRSSRHAFGGSNNLVWISLIRSGEGGTCSASAPAGKPVAAIQLAATLTMR